MPTKENKIIPISNKAYNRVHTIIHQHHYHT